MYQTAIEAAQNRKTKALEEAENVYQMQLDRYTEAIEDAKAKHEEINKDAEQRMQSLLQGVHAFDQHAVKRDTAHDEALAQLNKECLAVIQKDVDQATQVLNEAIRVSEDTLEDTLHALQDEEERLKKACDSAVNELEQKREVKANQVERLKTQKAVAQKDRLEQVEKQFKQASSKIKNDTSMKLEALKDERAKNKEAFEHTLNRLKDEKDKARKHFESMEDQLSKETASKIADMQNDMKKSLRETLQQVE
jgi:DNA repair exonuclease SbcCD ATPase subunit